MLSHITRSLFLVTLFCAGCKTARVEPEPCPVAAAPCAVQTNGATGTHPLAGRDLFTVEYKGPATGSGKRLWATSFLYDKAPDIVAQKWLGDEPDTEGKYVLLEIWNTWCPPCRRSLAKLNEWHEKHGDELVVIGLCDEKEEAVTALMETPGHNIDFHNGIDTNGATRTVLGVTGVPHVIIIEPDGYVVWEGFPYQPGYELTDAIIKKILAVGRKQRAE